MRILNLNEKDLTVGWVVSEERSHQPRATFILKATFRLSSGEAPVTWGDEPDPLSGELYYEGDPQGSLSYESDFAPFKPRADMLVVGTAHAPGGRPVRELPVSIRVGGYSKALRVSGDRSWEGGPPHANMTGPELFAAMPLTYEYA